MSQDRSGSPIHPATSPETLAETRRLYEAAELTLAEIGGRVGLHPATVRRFARRDGWRRPAAAAERRALIGRIRRKVERQIAEAERAIGADAAGPDAERAARTLASLVRTLRELARYDEDQARAAAASRGVREADEDEPGAVADLDAFRDALADRLERLCAERQD
jgi:hypothetical protein